ncbi:MAG: DUF1549 domain-containing protein [Verrucomicrobiae bacterium]|nr:DUF1549 domain-containing protein [Verrucomicrobiae bacterium]
MKPLSLGIAAVFFSSLALSQAEKSNAPDLRAASAKIDQLIEKGLQTVGVKPNAEIDDATFLRRTYLDIAGRIPTIEEAESFHGSNYEHKRERLIEDLLQSEASVSHAYNFWADVLRINSGLGTGATQAEAAYQLWVKKALRENMPYDKFVYEMVRARGYVWENGAVGYYQRDRGMPLDNMSNTVRVFLGTRLECAQCHNHPFDKWTQMDYFKMAAFSYGMDANRYDSPNKTALAKWQKDDRADFFTKKVGVENFPQIRDESQLARYTESDKYESYLSRYKMTDQEFRSAAERSIAAYKSYDHETRGIKNAINELYNPIRYIAVGEKEKTLKLPHDYQYSDAEPLSPVTAGTMFGADIDLEKIDDSTIDAYAAWLTSKENPTFTKVIANRLWKRVYGMGLFEPVDELTDQTVVANPELLAYLVELMRDLNFDMKAYLQVLYNTKTYQRAADGREVELGTPYDFAGPMLRRMSAEQIWDSIVALALPEADSYRPRLKAQVASVEKVRRIYEALEERPEDEYLAMVKQLGSLLEKNTDQQNKVREKLYAAREAENDEAYREARNELSELRKEMLKEVSEVGYQRMGEKVDGGELLAAMGMSEMTMMMDDSGEPKKKGKLSRAVLTSLPKPEMPEPPADLDRQQLKTWKAAQAQEYKTYQSLVSQLARASELESPARRGHFLREFGQSDREVIENASGHASVPQALNLLNGQMVEALTNKFAVFGSRIHSAGTPEEKTKMIFQAMLTREPTPREIELVNAEIANHGDEAFEGIVWALLNTQQFLFVQ